MTTTTTDTTTTIRTAWRIVDTTTGDPLPGLHESHRAAQEWVAARDWADDRGLTIVETEPMPAPSVPWADRVKVHFDEYDTDAPYSAEVQRVILAEPDLPGVLVYRAFELVDGEWLPDGPALVEVDTDGDRKAELSDPADVRALVAALAQAADLLARIETDAR